MDLFTILNHKPITAKICDYLFNDSPDNILFMLMVNKQMYNLIKNNNTIINDYKNYLDYVTLFNKTIPEIRSGFELLITEIPIKDRFSTTCVVNNIPAFHYHSRMFYVVLLKKACLKIYNDFFLRDIKHIINVSTRENPFKYITNHVCFIADKYPTLINKLPEYLKTNECYQILISKKELNYDIDLSKLPVEYLTLSVFNKRIKFIANSGKSEFSDINQINYSDTCFLVNKFHNPVTRFFYRKYIEIKICLSRPIYNLFNIKYLYRNINLVAMGYCWWMWFNKGEYDAYFGLMNLLSGYLLIEEYKIHKKRDEVDYHLD